MNIPYFEASEIRKVPVYLRWRYMTVFELMKKANVELAAKNKAMGVYDWSKFHKI